MRTKARITIQNLLEYIEVHSFYGIKTNVPKLEVSFPTVIEVEVPSDFPKDEVTFDEWDDYRFYKK